MGSSIFHSVCFTFASDTSTDLVPPANYIEAVAMDDPFEGQKHAEI